MTRLALRTLLVALAASFTLGVAGADAATYPNTAKGALADCGAGNDPLVGHYSVGVLETALRGLSTANKEYSTCSDSLDRAIRQILAAGAHPHNGSTSATGTSGGGGGGKTGSDKTASDVAKGKVKAALAQGGESVKVSGHTIIPGAVTVRDSSFLSTLPTPLIVVLAALLATLAALAGRALLNLVRARRAG